MVDQSAVSAPGPETVHRNPAVAAVLALLPGLGHLYLGDRRQGLILLAADIGGFAALFIGPTALAPGRQQLAVSSFVFYVLLYLPVLTVYSVLDVLRRFAAPQRADRSAAVWAISFIAIGLVGVGWVLRQATLERAADILFVWPFFPLGFGLHSLIVHRRGHRLGLPVRPTGGLALLVCLTAVVIGLWAAPVHLYATGFPFTSTLRLPQVFNLEAPRHVAEQWLDETRPAAGLTSVTYVYDGVGNVKVTGDRNTTQITIRTLEVARGESAAAARARLVEGAVTSVTTDGSRLAIRPSPPPAEQTTVTRDVALTVPAQLSVEVRTHCGTIRVSGVDGDVTIRSDWGEVGVTGGPGKIDVIGEDGAVRVTGSGPISAVTRRGPIILCLPSDASVDLKATTSGLIKTALQVSRMTDDEGRRAWAKVGDGRNLVILRSAVGDIVIITGK